MVGRETLERAKELLMRDEEQNIYPLLLLGQGGVGACWISGGSVCLWDKQHNKYCYAVRSASELRELFATVRQRGEASVSLLTDEKWMETVLALDGALLVNHCTQFRPVPYPGTPPTVPGVRFGGVDERVAEWILTVYDHPELSVDFILRRAKAAPAIAALNGQDAPVGFFITHSNAELGPVYVNPSYRGSGLADALYAEMAGRLPKDEPWPILFVFPQNHASQKWLRRLGCVPAPRQVAWFWKD